MKGVSRTVVLSLESWLCPWCFASKYPKPSHYFLESKETVIDVDGSTVYNFSSEFKKLSDSIASTVSKSVKNVEAKLLKHNEKLEEMSTSLSMLKQNIDPSSTYHQSASNYATKLSQPSVVISPPEPEIANQELDFLNSDECAKLKDFLSKVEYSEEKCHKVKNFGEEYKYTGAADLSKDEIPDELLEIAAKIKTKYPGTEINECLVNRYVNGKSSIGDHSDDEPHIDPDSSIFCVSVGQERKIIFTDKFSGRESEHLMKSGSMYVMTRTSQAYYRHRIDSEDNCNSERYSLTFRYVKKNFARSTIIIGDSNTKNLTFGGGAGTFGVGLPGKVVKASMVEDINPYDCVAYSNVIFVVGTNNLRSKYISNRDDVLKSFHEKISIIQKIRKDIKIIIMPVLPTRLADMNRHIVCYNRMLFEQYVTSCPSFNIRLPALYEFLDKERLLRRDCARDGDYIHLNALGLSRLARVIKDAIFNKTISSGVGKRSPHVQHHRFKPP